MSVVQIKIQSLDDAKKGHPIFDDINNPSDYLLGEVTGFGVLQGGMQSGATSVMLKIKSEASPIPIIAELSAEMFQTLAGALTGAEQKFIDDIRKGN